MTYITRAIYNTFVFKHEADDEGVDNETGENDSFCSTTHPTTGTNILPANKYQSVEDVIEFWPILYDIR